MPKRKTKNSTIRERSHERNWSELPQEILHLFSKKLSDISDFIRFRAVCKRWQSSAPVTDPPPQLPWLVERCENHKENSIIRFYCLLSGKVHTIYCPGSRCDRLEGHACGYMLATHRLSYEMYLLNPLNNDQFCVPLVNVIDELPDYIGPDQFEGGNIVVISGLKACQCSERAATLYLPLQNVMAFWRPKSNDWVYVDGVGNNLPSANAFHMGQYFSDDGETGITNVINIATKKLAYQVAPPQDTNPLLKGHTVMVESGGRILRLFQHYEAEQCHFAL